MALSLAYAIPRSADAETKERPTRLELRQFNLRDGEFWELAVCEVAREGMFTPYVCQVFNVGTQRGEWIAGDALEGGVRVRPFQSRTWLTLGAAVSVLGALVACDGNPDDCDDPSLPMEAYVAAGLQIAVPAGKMDLLASAICRYHVSLPGKADFEAPQGPAVSLGLGFAFR